MYAVQTPINVRFCHDFLRNMSLVVLAILSQLMAEKTEEPILHVRGWVKRQILIAVAG